MHTHTAHTQACSPTPPTHSHVCAIFKHTRYPPTTRLHLCYHARIQFVTSCSSAQQQQDLHDDLLFIVHSREHTAAAGGVPYSVKRRAVELPSELQLSSPAFSRYAWPETLLLNAALQTRYRLTVVACR